MRDNLLFIELQSDHLLYKWGFDDGDILIPVLRDSGFPKIEEDNDFWVHFNSLVLCEIVECFVCTQIENSIRPYRCWTSHNPVRVYEVDGKHVSELPQDNLLLLPHSVTVTSERIVSVAKRLYDRRHEFKDEKGDWNYMIPSDFAMRVRREQGWDL